MRILMLSWEFPPRIIGGLSRHVYELSRALAEEGCLVHVITCWEKGLPEHEVVDGVCLHRVQPYQAEIEIGFLDWVQRLNFAMLEKSASLIMEKGRFDLVHAHDWLVANAARAVKHAFKIPLITTIHATEYGRNKGLHNEQQRYISGQEWWLAYESWKVICCSEFMKRELQQLFQLPEDKLVVIPNGIKIPEREKSIVLEKRDEKDRDRFIFYIGRLVPEKGVQVLLEAAPLILERFSGAKFVIAGTGPFEEHLRKMTRELGLEDKVLFQGYIEDWERDLLYRTAALAVFPSYYEPFGIVALEAMIFETPLVVTSTGGFDEIVEHGIDGLKAAPGDPVSLAEQICLLLENKKMASSIARQGYLKASGIYSWHKIAGRTSEIYEGVVLSPENQSWKKEEVPGKEILSEKLYRSPREAEAPYPS